ncbi:hypothetical protein IRJ41_001778 [Triplophysa rosa]|uniref:Sterile alpha motif domain-containing protein 3 n=1 Tax=Triplophysa rosa TaxID=992332 RepID=A0A9W8C2V5_TRIRA|nr:hypothetical protein IRJ41_001778 [Triplophysa rosa]
MEVGDTPIDVTDGFFTDLGYNVIKGVVTVVMEDEDQITVTLTILHRVLATVFIDGKETWRKLFTVGSVEELINSVKTELSQQVSVDRILRFDTHFQEFIDTDLNTELREFDILQIYYITNITQAPLERSVQPLPCHSTDATTTGLLALLEEKAPTVLREHEETKMLSISSIKLLVKVAVSDLVEKHGFYPSGKEKLALAKEIVLLFPSLRISVPFGQNEGHEHFFDGPSHSGFIEMRLRNIRRKLQQSQRTYSLKRRHCKLQPSSPSLEETVPSEWLTLIKRMRPSTENSSSIKNAIDQTFSYRRKWIMTKSPTVGEIFKEYPRFLDMPSLINHRFAGYYKDVYKSKCEADQQAMDEFFSQLNLPSLSAEAKQVVDKEITVEELHEMITYTSSIHVSNNINFLGTTYRTGCILPLKTDERGEPLFGEVIHIIPQIESECAFMFLRVLRVKYFDEHFFSFNVTKTKEFDMAKLPDDLKDYRPLDIVSFCDQQYVTPRYKVLF